MRIGERSAVLSRFFALLAVRVGIGYDVHRLGGGRPFILGGVRISSSQGPVGHSDGDVLLHALIDALLGAAGLGDIGGHFPTEDPQWQGVESLKLLEHAFKRVREGGFRVHNVDATVMLEHPRLAPYIPQIRSTLAAALGVAPDRVNVKAKTNEGLDALGRGRAVAAQAVVLMAEPSEA